jgi:hypothetical protein
LERDIKTVAGWILEAGHMVAFTGAGISTDSGIPDFRGPDGVWTRRDAGLPTPRWRVPPGQVQPNASHHSLVALQRLSKLQFLITPNTDNLHRSSSRSMSGPCPSTPGACSGWQRHSRSRARAGGGGRGSRRSRPCAGSCPKIPVNRGSGREALLG